MENNFQKKAVFTSVAALYTVRHRSKSCFTDLERSSYEKKTIRIRPRRRHGRCRLQHRFHRMCRRRCGLTANLRVEPGYVMAAGPAGPWRGRGKPGQSYRCGIGLGD